MNIKKVDFDALLSLVEDGKNIKEITEALCFKTTSETKRFIFELCQREGKFFEVAEGNDSKNAYINTKGKLVVSSDFIKEFATSCDIKITKETKVDVSLNKNDKSIMITLNM